ncbi:MAG: FecR family protein [Mangrovibacterium sp.]
MDNLSNNLLEKFLSEQRLTDREFNQLENLLQDKDGQQELSRWLEKEWQHSKSETVALRFEQIRSRIKSRSARPDRIRQFVKSLSRVAAFLFIPVLIAAVYFYSNRVSSSELLTLSTQKGEQTSVVLPDGSKVWLNVDTKLSYPVGYGVQSRRLILEGEAYFEVAKNKELPFEVSSGGIVTKATGTTFIVSSYPTSSEVRSSLVEGTVEIRCNGDVKVLKPGQQVIYRKESPAVIVQSFDIADELGWKNEQLVFRLMPFEHVLSELEKWYDIEFEYNPTWFKSETFTAKFNRFESLEQVLEVLSKAGGFSYRIEGKIVEIRK